MKIALYGNTYQRSKSEHIVMLLEALRKYDVQLYIEQNYYDFLCEQFTETLSATPFVTIEDNIDVVISVGGDGTFLRTAEQVAGKCIPILGINIRVGNILYFAPCLSRQKSFYMESYHLD